jgi:hypothetical protein
MPWGGDAGCGPLVVAGCIRSRRYFGAEACDQVLAGRSLVQYLEGVAQALVEVGKMQWKAVGNEQGVKLLGLLLTWSAGRPLANRNGLACHIYIAGWEGIRVGW